ncbi:MAG: SRPBCC family protein [Chloroflexota bacterium]|nr:SRPBCC family protein [Chloroflexota bacterium]
MPEYEHTQRIQASPEEVFAFVSDVSNLPKYLPTTKSAEPQGEERVRVQGEANGRRYDSDGYFRVDPVARRLEWGADEQGKYSGWLTVSGEQSASEVTVHLSFGPATDLPERIEESSPGEQPIQQGLEASLASIQNLVEGHGEKVEPPAAT